MISNNKTIVKLDVKDYEKIINEAVAKGLTGEDAVNSVKEIIYKHVDKGFEAIGQKRKTFEEFNSINIKKIRVIGDSVEIIFELASEAHNFTEAVHKSTEKDNEDSPNNTKLWFRSGAATDNIDEAPDENLYKGVAFTIACRLEKEAFPGELLVDKATYEALPPKLQKKYGDIEEVNCIDKDKKEKYFARGCKMIAKASLDGDIKELVQTTKSILSKHTQQQCGTISFFNTLLGLDNIYINTYINIKTSNNDFKQKEDEKTRDIEATDKYSKLIILGQPGAGKTTFLKYLAIENNKSDRKYIPLFVSLKDFDSNINPNGLSKYITQQLENKELTNNKRQLIFAQHVEKLLLNGKLLILLDGLDEVKEKERSEILNQIKNLATKYKNNKFFITCRVSLWSYELLDFTQVIIDEFDEEQVEEFVIKWANKHESINVSELLQKLNSDERIKELATSPLLLALICLVFQEKGKFSSNRCDLYEEGVEVLLEKWDTNRYVRREEVYKQLSLRRKKDLLSKIAYLTFKDGHNDFKEEEVLKYITQYIRNLPSISNDSEALRENSRHVLKAIQAQHGLLVEQSPGIYSFSHLTFHEYFTAREIKEAGDNKLLLDLCTHITEKRWREVFLLTVGILNNSDSLLQLMKQQIDGLLADAEKLQRYLVWVEEKSNSVEAIYKPAAVRAYYFTLGLKLNFNFNFNQDFDFSRSFSRDLFLFLDPDLVLPLDEALKTTLYHTRYYEVLPRYLNRDLNLDKAEGSAGEDELKCKLVFLNTKLPSGEDVNTNKQWWKENGANWTQQLWDIAIKHRNIGHDWQFTDHERELLKKYQDANKLLVDCLNSDCYVSRDIRQHIEDTLLLPINSIAEQGKGDE